jgi:hypothetical protein
MPYINKRGKKVWVDELQYDPSPEFHVDVNEDGTLDHSGAYDPKHECRCDKLDTAHRPRECADA